MLSLPWHPSFVAPALAAHGPNVGLRQMNFIVLLVYHKRIIAVCRLLGDESHAKSDLGCCSTTLKIYSLTNRPISTLLSLVWILMI